MTPGPTIRIPRWIQLVGLPVLLVLGWLVAGMLGHVLFLFLAASVIAFLLNPLVRDLQRLRIPRGLAVADGRRRARRRLLLAERRVLFPPVGVE